jgi:di/tricarboxylate transporter
MPMTPEITVVLFLLVGSIIVFALEWMPVDLVGLSIIGILIVTRILTPDQAFSGFSNQAIVMIGGLLVISGGLYHSGITDTIGRRIYQFSGRSQTRLLVFIMSAEVAVSAFMNNVAATAMFLPGVTALAKKANVNVSKLLIPLAYASMLGGTCTLIGTSTNIAVNGLLQAYKIQPFGFFEYTPVGLTIAIAGTLFVLLTEKYILPNHPEGDTFPRDYISEAVVLPSSSLVGKSILQSGLERLELLPVGIIRQGQEILAPSPQYSIEVKDILLVQGKAQDILKIKSIEGLEIREDVLKAEW